MVDPRSDSLDELYSIIDQQHQIIASIKLYSLIGYYATAERLCRFYELCQRHRLSVMLHCSPHNAVHYSGDDIDDLLDSTHPYYFRARSKKKKAGNFAHPSHTVQLAGDFPDVNFCLAHFGGTEEWRQFIIAAMANAPNLYTDISFTFNKKREQRELKQLLEQHSHLRDKVLFGDDAYMIKTISTGNPFASQLHEAIGDYWYDKISGENALRFLKWW